MVFARYVPHVVIAAAVFSAACGSNPRARVPPPPRRRPLPAPAQAVPVPPTDPVAALLPTSARRFQVGEQELALGHLTSARLEFDRALEVILESPLGLRADAAGQGPATTDCWTVSLHARRLPWPRATDSLRSPPNLPDRRTVVDVRVHRGADRRPAAAIKETVTADLAATQRDIDIPLNERVLAYVELFQGRLRDWFDAGLRRGTQYLPMIQQVFRAEGLPLDLAYIPLIESAFKPNAVSRAEAKGVWQFMRGTALENGLKHDWYIDERADPEKATKAAAKYLKTLQPHVRWRLASGPGVLQRRPGTVQRAMKRSGAEDFWELSENGRYLPRETREYVPIILAAIIIARNPAQYGFDVGRRNRPGRTTRSPCHRPSTCDAWPSGPARRLTRSRRSTRNCAAGRRRSGQPTT